MQLQLRHGASVAALILGTTALMASVQTTNAAAKLDSIYSFCSQSGCPDGDQPYGGVTLLSSNKLIGSTGFGGTYNGGTVFSLTDKHGAAKLKTLQSFCAGTPPSCQPDEGPSTTLIQDTSGNIYGVLYFGGSSGNGDGAVFELKAKNRKYALHYLYQFNGTDGFGPDGLSYAGQSSGALYDGKSPLYGTTIAGGTEGAGIVYSLAPQGSQWNFQTVYNFCSAANCTDGGLPEAGVLVDPSGNLLGTTEYYGAQNGGTIYQLSNSGGTWTDKVLYTLCNAGGSCTDGSGSYGGVAEDSAGNLYGTTYFGGKNHDGVVFELAANGKYSVLHSFCSESNCTDGSQPFAGVALDSSGNVFGITSRGGDGNYGVLFEVAKGKYKRLYSWCSQNGCSDGGYPYGTLAIDKTGQIYGTTQYGGGYGLGEVYRLKP
ncbi:MAG TPA: choice-of-anchor tandem repeat GloVer-containing protein [Rhizomicrobium sp.]|jgi:uncharacterized repeat protein (TIGR03803 family)